MGVGTLLEGQRLLSERGADKLDGDWGVCKSCARHFLFDPIGRKWRNEVTVTTTGRGKEGEGSKRGVFGKHFRGDSEGSHSSRSPLSTRTYGAFPAGESVNLV